MSVRLHRIDGKTQARLDALMAKNNEGTITAAERKELAYLGGKVERLSLENAKMLNRHAEAQKRARATQHTTITRPRRKTA
jgi:hypothetical protein